MFRNIYMMTLYACDQHLGIGHVFYVIKYDDLCFVDVESHSRYIIYITNRSTKYRCMTCFLSSLRAASVDIDFAKHFQVPPTPKKRIGSATGN